MKKMYFFAALIAVAVMFGCSESDNVSGQPDEPQKLVLTAHIIMNPEEF